MLKLSEEQRRQAFLCCHEIDNKRCVNCPAYPACKNNDFYYIPQEQVESYDDYIARLDILNDNNFYNESPESAKLKANKEECTRKIWEIECFIDCIKSIKLKTAFELKYYKHCSNQVIATRLHYCDEGTIRKQIKKYFSLSDFSEP